ncbi:MAG: hypothetical protein IV086_02510 [Hyphomonadaceae bacterium]|nr:hypothetical protein [Hyphomonadaceae bacterium]
MSDSGSVRPSRDGDQFHYLWAARRCLSLLTPTSGLVALSIEGPSPEEGGASETISVGTDLIDVGEYYGSEDLTEASLIRYTQLKHSTRRTESHWTPSELENTLAGFAKRYVRIAEKIGATVAVGKVEFSFASNRSIAANIVTAIEEGAQGRAYSKKPLGKKLERLSGLAGSEWSDFCKTLRFSDHEDGYWDLRNVLTQDVTGYLADADRDAPIQLKELVTRKALTESESNPMIRKHDVLRALNTDESHLFPAPSLVSSLHAAIPRAQERDLSERIVDAAERVVIVHAQGGVGKSVLANRIGLGMPPGSVTIVYDCFGNGQYRSASGYRHRHKDALVQIANELCSRGLCHPLVPTSRADPADYVKAFLHRLRQTIAILQEETPGALLCIVIDAADNAQLAAEEIGENRSFVADLIREGVPPGVRLVFTARTHRVSLLNAASTAFQYELEPFTIGETETHLRQTFEQASDLDVQEFHRLSSQNPRVQALALSWGGALSDTLRRLGPNPTTVEAAIEGLLDKSIAALMDSTPAIERAQIESICSGLAILRPLVPIQVLAALANVEPTAVRSFALDLGRPLLVTGDSIQFLDEPVETWFRQRFRPDADALKEFVALLTPIASRDAYAASVLPQLLLEAGHFSDLVALALSSDGLPDASEIQRKDIELQRLQFAFKASLRMRRYTDASMLAFRAGGESAGDERKWASIQTNTDLAARFMNVGQVEETVARRTFGGGWFGSHHAYEAGLLSGRPELMAEARSRLRMAEEWLQNWSRLSDNEREAERVTAEDVAELAMAHLNIHGAQSCAERMRVWRPESFRFRVGRLLARRLVDHGRFAEIDEVATAADTDTAFILAITLELRAVLRVPPAQVVARVIKSARAKKFSIAFINRGNSDWDYVGLEAITAIVEAACVYSIGKKSTLAAVLTKGLPDSPPRSISVRFGSNRFPLMRAYTLRAQLLESVLELADLAHTSLRAELQNAQRHHDSEELTELKEVVGAMLPWHNLWARALAGGCTADSVVEEIQKAAEESRKAERHTYRERYSTTDEVALLWLEVLVMVRHPTVASLTNWMSSSNRPVSAAGLTRLARVAAHSDTSPPEALVWASAAFALMQKERVDAQSKAENLLNLARATLHVGVADAQAYFDEAVAVSSKIGDENLDRWSAILDLAKYASKASDAVPRLAYEVSRAAELTYEYVERDKHFDWLGTVEALVSLCPSSSVAILSRWRDRTFGWHERLLSTMIEALTKREELSASLAVSLVPFRAQWAEEDLLRSALTQCTDQDAKKNIAQHVYRYFSLQSHSSERWKTFSEVLSECSVDLPEAKARSEFEMSGAPQTEAGVGGERRDEHNWDEIFHSLDLTSPDDIEEANRRFRAADPPYYDEYFLQNACQRVGIGMEPSLIAALADAPFFDWYRLRVFLLQVPDAWKARPAIASAVATLIRAMARRAYLEISTFRRWEPFPFEIAYAVSGVSEAEIAEIVLSALGTTTEVLTSERLFSAVGLIASCAGVAGARDALSFSLDQFKPLLKADDGDGPWREDLAAPTTVEESIAGYVWSALGAPESRVRWEAAHVVRALCSLKHSNTLDRVIEYAQGRSNSAFVDAGLKFYALNAQQWLFIAIARVAIESPAVLKRHANFIEAHATAAEEHIVVRKFAADAAVALIDAGVIPEWASRRVEFMSSTNSPFPEVDADGSEDADPIETVEANAEEDTFFFGIDMGPYWFNSLGRVFAKAQVDVERRARQVLKEWGYVGTGRWDEDQRGQRRLYKEDETRHSHGTSPRTDDLRFYLSYHAMMIVAGRLLATTPLRRRSTDAYDSFPNWLAEHCLSRFDGRWLFDRREPRPLERPAWRSESDDEDWRWSVQRGDFDRSLGLPSDLLNLWGYWTAIDSGRQESVHVSSALVSPSRSMSLLRALQTTRNSRDYRIPHANDDTEIDIEGFRLKGWIADRQASDRLDEYDPWAAGIRWPPYAPAEFVVQAMDLCTGEEEKRWSRNSSKEEAALISQVWGEKLRRSEDGEGDNGARLQATRSFLREMLLEMKMDLIVEVTIERRSRHSSYGRDYSDDGGYFAPYARLFVIKSDGSVSSL